MKLKTILGLLSVCAMAVLASGCASSAESETDTLGEAEQAVTADAPAADSKASPLIEKKKKEDAVRSTLAGTLSGPLCSTDTSGRTMQQLITVPPNSTLTCTTVGNTTLDTVLALMFYANDWNSTRGPCDSPYTDKIPWYMLAFNDDSNSTVQSTVTWTNRDGIARTPRLVGFLYSGSNGGSINVTCNINGGSSTNYAGDFSSGSCRAWPPSPEIYTTAGGADTTLLAIVQDLSNQNSKSNDDAPAGGPTPSPQSWISGMTVNTKTWFIDLGCFGATPRTTTINSQ